MFVAIGTLLVIAIITAFFYTNLIKNQCHDILRIHDLQTANNLLQNSSLESRAKPNQRLIIAFGIENSFTTSSPSIHRRFVTEVKTMVKNLEAENWRIMTEQANEFIDDEIENSRYGMKIQLIPLVQRLVLTVVFSLLFGPCLEQQNTDMTVIAEKINAVWLLSKHPEGKFHQKLAEEKAALHAAIKRVFNLNPELPIPPSQNPLNIILPAYETLWRVVLRCFLEVRFRSSPSELDHFGELLTHFHRNPTTAQLETRWSHWTPETQYGLNAPGMPVSVRDIVFEALRLYPPTKRIYRQHNSQVQAVDVESLHRDPGIWEEAALKFRPARWETIGWEELKAYMPFGAGRFVCPAKPQLAPMMIGILVAVLFRRFDELWKINDEKVQRRMDSEEPLDSGRDELSEIELVRD